VSWQPPAGTYLASVQLGWAAQVDNYNFMKVSIDDLGGNPLTDTLGKVHSDDRVGDARTFDGAESGFSMQANTIKASAANELTAQNGFTIQRAFMDVVDNNDPVIQSISAPAWGDSAPWITDGSTQCVTAPANDAGGGIVSAQIFDSANKQIANQDYHRGDYFIPGYTSGTFNACVATSQLPEGDNPMAFDVVDAGGNYQEADLGNISIERTAPAIKQTGGVGNGGTTTQMSGPSVAPAFSITTGPSGIGSATFTVDGASEAVGGQGADAWSFASAHPSFPEGAHNWSITVTSVAGLSTSLSGSFKVSFPAPTVVATQLPDSSSTVKQPPFSFRVTDANYDLERVDLSIDGKDAGDFDQAGDEFLFSSPVLAVGKHTWLLNAVSASGKQTPIQGSFTVTAVQYGAPKISIISVPHDTIRDSYASFSFRITAADDLKDVTLKVDGYDMGDPNGYGDGFTWDVSGFDIGAHDWEMIATSTTGKVAKLAGGFVVAGEGATANSTGTEGGLSSAGGTSSVAHGTRPTPAASKITRRVVAPARAAARKGQVAHIRVRVLLGAKAGAKAAKGAKVTCTVGSRAVSRVRTDAKGWATCSFKTTLTHTVRVSTPGAITRNVKLTVRR
jgi:hypothetical protein